MFNARAVFDGNHVSFSNAAGTPESAGRFYEKYITPAFEGSRSEGAELEAAYGEVIADYQRDGFIVGFNAAVQLLTGFAPGALARE